MKEAVVQNTYIKPQPERLDRFLVSVVYLFIPTSNHNLDYGKKHGGKVVYLFIPTSNHNLGSLSSYITGFYIKAFAKEVVADVELCCKTTKKIPIEEALSALFSFFPFPSN